MPRFTFIRLMIRLGPAVAIAVALLFPGVAWWAAVQFALPMFIIVIGAVVGLLAGFFLMVLTDLVRVMAEMLLPQQ